MSTQVNEIRNYTVSIEMEPIDITDQPKPLIEKGEEIEFTIELEAEDKSTKEYKKWLEFLDKKMSEQKGNYVLSFTPEGGTEIDINLDLYNYEEFRIIRMMMSENDIVIPVDGVGFLYAHYNSFKYLLPEQK